MPCWVFNRVMLDCHLIKKIICTQTDLCFSTTPWPIQGKPRRFFLQRKWFQDPVKLPAAATSIVMWCQEFSTAVDPFVSSGPPFHSLLSLPPLREIRGPRSIHPGPGALVSLFFLQVQGRSQQWRAWRTALRASDAQGRAGQCMSTKLTCKLRDCLLFSLSQEGKSLQYHLKLRPKTS